MNYYLNAWKKFATFTGRARRSEYWFFVLFNTLAIITILLLGTFLKSPFFFALYILYAIAALLPGLAVGVRRMHDTGKSGWFLLIPIYSLILVFTAGDAGENRYGADPKAPEFEEFLDPGYATPGNN